MDWQILRLWSMLIVKPKIELTLKQWSATVVSHPREIIRVTQTVWESAHEVEIYIYLTVRSVLQLGIELIIFG